MADRNANIYSMAIESSADGDPGNVYDNDSTTSTATSAKEENSGWNSSVYNANINSQLTIESSADGDPANVYDNASSKSTATTAKEENSGWSLYNTSQSQRQWFNTAWQASAEHATPLERKANATPAAATRAPCFILSRGCCNRPCVHFPWCRYLLCYLHQQLEQPQRHSANDFCLCAGNCNED